MIGEIPDPPTIYRWTLGGSFSELRRRILLSGSSNESKPLNLDGWLFFFENYLRILPKNEANHGRTGDFETIYFQFWGGLLGLVIDSMERVLTI